MADRDLLRLVIGYLSADGWQPYQRNDWPFQDGMSVLWRRDGVLIGIDRTHKAPTVFHNDLGEVRISSVQQVANQLHDWGLLPVEFHSAYTAGLSAAHGSRADLEDGRPVPAYVEGFSTSGRTAVDLTDPEIGGEVG